MAWGQEDLDKVERAIANPQRRVRFADREVEYKNIDSLLQARQEIKTDLMAATKARRRMVRLFGSIS